ncbi:MAG: tail fiber domain-containing protein, partial [Bernardetiaceae bacterium]|nr:tail fiber domain-containing protein [Bernardetiaceae bacterium]
NLSNGENNTALGYGAGYPNGNITLNNCTFIGANSKTDVNNRNNVTMLGANIAPAQNTADNQVLLGNTAIGQIRAQVGSITTYSDKRFKYNIQEDVKGLDFIKRLRPVSYNQNPEILHQLWGTSDSLLKQIDHSQIKQMRFVGLIAQEVEQAMRESGYTNFPGIDIPRNEKEVYTLRYGDFIIPLIKAVQEQQQIIEQQNQAIQLLETQVHKLQHVESELHQIKNLLQILQAQAVPSAAVLAK